MSETNKQVRKQGHTLGRKRDPPTPRHTKYAHTAVTGKEEKKVEEKKMRRRKSILTHMTKLKIRGIRDKKEKGRKKKGKIRGKKGRKGSKVVR